MPRPRIPIDPRQVEAYTRLGSPVREIADALGVSESTIRNRFKKLLAKSRALRRMKLREFQWIQARKGNVPMLIFLGKEELGQCQEVKEMHDLRIIRRMVNRGDT
jgi:predicted transcriptional regulator